MQQLLPAITSEVMVKRDMFQIYSSQGVAANELESFGVNRDRPAYTNEGMESFTLLNKRKTRVSAEISPLLLFEEFLSKDDFWNVDLDPRTL